MRRRASALLIAMLVISIVGVIGFGMVHLTFRELRINNDVAASPRAYEAAQAGIEYALLQYRYDKDYNFGGSADGKQISVDDTSFFKIKMSRTTKSPDNIIGESKACFSSTFSTPATFLNCDGSHGQTMGVLPAGEEISISRPEIGSFYLRALIADPTLANGVPATVMVPSTDGGALVISAYANDNDVSPAAQYTYVLNNPSDWQDIGADKPATPLQSLKSVLNVAKRLTLRFIYPPIDPTKAQDDKTGSATVKLYFALFSTYNVPLPADPLNNIAHQPLSTDRTTIESIGYADGVQRRLQAVLNNRTNQLISVYDYSNPTSGMVDYTIYGTNLITN